MRLANREADRVLSNAANEIIPFVEVNEVLQVRIPDDPNPVTYYGRVQDVSSQKLLISWPTDRGIRMIVRKRQTLDFYFIREGIPNNFIGLVDETQAAPLPQLGILVKTPVRQVQRRQNFRVKCLLPIEIFGTKREDPANESSPALTIRTVSTDLSAGGISFRHAERIPEGMLVNIKLSIPDSGPAINIPCAVIYSDYISEHQTMHRTGLRYIALSEGERSRIVRFVYRTQLQGLHP
jgi:c-di-GMP-binding flagellar brake protein YcgR